MKNHIQTSRLLINSTLLMATICMIVSCNQQPPPTDIAQERILQPTDFFTDHKQAKLMILGTFHFKDAGLDGFKPTDMDIMSDEKQMEILQLVDKLADFKPTIVALEWLPRRQKWIDSTYASYLNGRFELRANEIFQLGFRVAERSGARLVCVDATQRIYDEWLSLERIKEIAVESDQAHYLDQWQQREKDYEAYFEYKEKLKHEKYSLVEYMKLTNTDQEYMNNYGWYMQQFLAIGKEEEFPWIDEWTRWHNRNYRIFGNLLRLIETGDERILLIIGTGHVPLLKQSAIASPDMEFVDVLDYLK